MIWALLLLLGTAPASGMGRARAIVHKSLEARGGAARFAALRSYDQRGELIFANGQHWAVWARHKEPNLFRLEVATPQGKLVQGYDGHTAWQIDPGGHRAHALTGAQLRQLEDEGDQGIDMAVRPAAHGITIAYAGRGTIEARPYIAVRFTFPTGDAFTQFFDPRSGLQFHEQFPLPGGRHGDEAIRDYHRAAGLLFPNRYVNLPGPTLAILSRRFDVPLDGAIFAPPR